jgi:prepilin-type N-terminal cleavage/methylation domain-containing protein
VSVSPRQPRGFTLIEVMTAVVILIILSALAVTYMVYGMGRARMNNAVFDATALINAAQLRAISRGSPHYVVISQVTTPPPQPTTRLRLQVLERPDSSSDPANWDALDMGPGAEVALRYTAKQPDGSTVTANAPIRDQLVLGNGAGASSNGLSFMDLDSTRIQKPLPAPFSAISMTTLYNASPLDQPSTELRAGCNFCVFFASSSYGILRFNADGTMDVLTGNGAAESGAAIAFAPSNGDEKSITPKLITISHPAGATIVF